MLTNVITDAFNGVTSIPVACDLLEAFASLAKRPAVQRAVEKRAAEVHVEFLTQVREWWSWESGGHTPGHACRGRLAAARFPLRPRYCCVALHVLIVIMTVMIL